MKIAILGEKKINLGFRALGIEVLELENKEDFEKIKQTIKEYGVILVPEQIFLKFQKEIEELSKMPLPAFLIIPGIRPQGIGKTILEKSIERALGTKLIKI